MKEKRGLSNPPAGGANLSGYSHGGVNFATSSSTQMKTLGDTNNLGAIIKNKEIFERA